MPPAGEDGMHTLVLRPLDPGMVVYKIAVDLGGYNDTFMNRVESPYEKN